MDSMLKIKFEGSSEVQFYIPNPTIESIIPDGTKKDLINPNEKINFSIKGLYLKDIENIIFESENF